MKYKHQIIITIFTLILTGCNVFLGRPQNPVPSLSSVEPESTLVVVESPPVGIHSIGDGGFLSDNPCSAPCFLEILPGETLFGDVSRILSKYGYDDCYIFAENVLACNSSKSVISFAIGANQSGSVTRVSFFPATTIYLDDVLRKYGEPSQVVVGDAGISVEPMIFVKLLFDTIRTRITLTENFEINYDVSGTSEVQEIEYFDEVEYSAIKQIDYQPWNGYGQYAP